MPQQHPADRDDIMGLVQRLQQAAAPRPKKLVQGASSSAPTAEDIAWVEQMQLPTEFFDYFTIERKAA